jgi:intracellular multiplication protein IcmP
MAGQQQQQNTDNSLAILWGTALVFAIGWLIWHFFHPVIAYYIVKLRLYEMQLIAWVMPSTKPLVMHLQSTVPQELGLSDLARISTMVGHYLRFPIGASLLGFAVLIYLNRANLRFKKTYNMQSLATAEQQNWVQITPVVQLDLINTDIDTGPWAMALTPLQFAMQKRLLVLEENKPALETAVATLGKGYIQARLEYEAARQAFIVQLGAYWEGSDALSLPAKALFAIFAARAARDRPAADALMSQISRSAMGIHWDSGSRLMHRLNFTGTEALLKKYIDHPVVVETVNKHAYVLTVMAAMLVLGRQDGVLASSEFLWLKPCDRALWFMLNCVGRQTAYAEVAGPFAHWTAECAVGRKLRVPMVDMAVEALNTALREVRLSQTRYENNEMTEGAG